MKGRERGRGLGLRQPDWAGFRARAEGEMRRMGFAPEAAAAEARAMERRMRARIDWARSRFAEFLALQDAAGDAYCRDMDARPEIDWEAPDAPELPPPPEEVVADAIHAEVRAALEEDRWPRHLHFHGV